MAEPARTDQSSPPTLSQTAPSQLASDAVTEVGRVELREERAFVEKRRAAAGHVNIRREVERRSVVLSAELLSETLVIELRSGSSGVFIDGEPLMEGETREILTYREEAGINKQLVISEEVRIGKRRVTGRQTFEVELGREVLDVRQVEINAPSQEVQP